jgi:NADPH-dependent ferric siderophore reductase
MALEHATGTVPSAIAPDVASGVALHATTCDPHDADGLQAAIAEACGRIDLTSTSAYVFGELALTRRTATTLDGLGVDPRRVAVKPYWRGDRANEANGEPDRGSE